MTTHTASAAITSPFDPPGLPYERPTIVPDDSAAFALAAANPDVRVEIFEADWSRVDWARLRAARDGLAHRVGVHHLRALSCPLVRAALAAVGARAILVRPT